MLRPCLTPPSPLSSVSLDCSALYCFFELLVNVRTMFGTDLVDYDTNHDSTHITRFLLIFAQGSKSDGA
jgi:hypothetical protein